jgi:hypothetical protein
MILALNRGRRHERDFSVDRRCAAFISTGVTDSLP